MRQSLLIPVSLASMLSLLPSTALALGLGSLQIISEPGHPFKAVIPVQSVTISEGKSLLAGFPEHRDAYTMAGTSYPASGWKAVLVRKPSWHILVTAPLPVTQATALLVQAHWPGGQVMREYALPREAAVSAVHRPVPLSLSPVRPLTEEGIAQKTPSPIPLYQGWSRMDRYRVRAGQCLSDIAVALRGSEAVTPDQIMAALVRANPSAFVAGDPNRLQAGAALALPDLPQVQAMTPMRAFAWMHAQSVTPKVTPLPKKPSVPVTPKTTHAPATKLVLTSAPTKIPSVKKVVAPSPAAQLVAHRLMVSDQSMQEKMQDMAALADRMRTDLVKNADVIQSLRHAPNTVQQMLPWAAIGGNVLLLMLFVWIWRRQEKTLAGITENLENGI